MILSILSNKWNNLDPLRRSPFYSRLEGQKAQFFETMGWERPQWYESEELKNPSDAEEMPSLVDFRPGDFEGAHKESNWLFPKFARKKIN